MKYKQELLALQKELVQLQEWVREKNKRVIIIFEGRDSSGKGSAIKRLIQRLDPTVARVQVTAKPTQSELREKYFTKWRRTLPKKGEIVIYDRSWYTRCLVEQVMSFASEDQVTKFYSDVIKFEKKLHKDGVHIVKIWLSVSHKVQEERFKERLINPCKRWKLSPIDLASRTKFNEYTQAKEVMFNRTDFNFARWTVINGKNKKEARLNSIDLILNSIPYIARKERCPYALLSVPIEPDTPICKVNYIGFAS